ncbi:MAG: MFS transporter [Lachnospiraceae bacterium]|nr:MFS transporter [Lachnospiraceae bacterium]
MIKKLFKIYEGLEKEIYVLAIAKLVNALGYFVFPFLSLYLTGNLNISVAIVGIILAVINTISIPMTLLGGLLCKKCNNKAVAILPQLCSAICFFIVVFVNNVAAKIFFSGLGFSVSCVSQPAIDACLGNKCNSDKKTNAFSLVYFAQNVGFGMGSVVAGTIFKINPNIIFIVDAITTIISCIILYLFLANDYIYSDGKTNNDEGVKKNKLFVDYNKKEFFVLLILNAIAYGQIQFLLPLYLKEYLGSNSTVFYGFLVGLNSVLVIFLSPIVTQIFGQRKLSKTLFFGEFVFAVGYLTYGISLNKLSLLIAMFIFTLGEVLFSVCYMPYLVQDVNKNQVGMISSVANSFYKAGSILSPLVGGLIISFIGYRKSWMIVSGFLCIGCMIMRILIKENNE